jgi:hypothetical protein
MKMNARLYLRIAVASVVGEHPQVAFRTPLIGAVTGYGVGSWHEAIIVFISTQFLGSYMSQLAKRQIFQWHGQAPLTSGTHAFLLNNGGGGTGPDPRSSSVSDRVLPPSSGLYPPLKLIFFSRLEVFIFLQNSRGLLSYYIDTHDRFDYFLGVLRILLLKIDHYA